MFSCPVCNKVFRRKYNIKGHVLTVHEKQRAYVCDICPKKFSTKNSLKRHKAAKHEKQRSFKCDVCDRKLSTASSLKRHKRVKHDVKLFDIVDSVKYECKRFRYCDNQATFRIKPTPKNMNPIEWFYKVFQDILDYFKKTYTPKDNDIVGLRIHNSEFPNKDAYISMRKHKDLDVRTVINTISDVCQSNTDFKLIGDINVCYKHIRCKE